MENTCKLPLTKMKLLIKIILMTCTIREIKRFQAPSSPHDFCQGNEFFKVKYYFERNTEGSRITHKSIKS